MLTGVRSMSQELCAGASLYRLALWVRTHRGAVAVAGLLSFAGPVMFFTGALSVMPAPTPGNVARLAGWWTLYGLVLWLALLATGHACTRVDERVGRSLRAGVWMLGAAVAAAIATVSTTGRSTLLIEQGLVYGEPAMHAHALAISVVMALLYFAHVRRSGEHRRAVARLATAQAAQRDARRRIVEAKLHEVHARIDPDVLFAMLDAARRVYGTDPARGDRFLDELIAFLRAALQHARGEWSTLAREVDLARAYARLHALATGSEAELAIEVAQQARHARFPPGVLVGLARAACTVGPRCRIVVDRSPNAERLVVTVSATPDEEALQRVRALLADVYSPWHDARIVRTPTHVEMSLPHELA